MFVQSLTGFLSLGGSYPQPYQQIILEDATGKTANIVVCKQGLIYTMRFAGS